MYLAHSRAPSRTERASYHQGTLTPSRRIPGSKIVSYNVKTAPKQQQTLKNRAKTVCADASITVLGGNRELILINDVTSINDWFYYILKYLFLVFGFVLFYKIVSSTRMQ